MPTVQVCLQWTAVVFNTFTLIIGSLAALAGVYELFYKLEEGSTDHLEVEKLLQFAIAGTLILAAIIGCFGAFLGSIKHLVFLLLLICAHIWKLAHYNETKLLDATEVFVMSIWMKELVHPGAMQRLQHTYECCGNKGSNDYKSLSMKVPKSCFHSKDGLIAVYPYVEGCMAAVKRAHLQLYRDERLVHAGLMGYEIVGIILTITLCCQLTNKMRRYNY
ncbi:Tsp42Eo [Drosophila busckii]|uniref:Tsp42Eo n=1 Tax=Drosophila busckii TaxID=30019 RepID=A0A0M4EUT0_DROBS|nr:Tsp42Eo [Drosophila busckii]